MWTPVITTAETAAGAGRGALVVSAGRTGEAIESAAAALVATVTAEAIAAGAIRRWDGRRLRRSAWGI